MRAHNIPYLGLCYGMQLAAVEFARSLCALKNAHTTEVNAQTDYPIIDILPTQKEFLADQAYGGTMRLGSYTATIKPESKVAKLYALEASSTISERHRHRYEVNPQFVPILEKQGLSFSAIMSAQMVRA